MGGGRGAEAGVEVEVKEGSAGEGLGEGLEWVTALSM